MNNVVLNEFGFAVSFKDYANLTIPKDCISFTPQVYEDFTATANQRESIIVESGNPRYISVGNCLVEPLTGRLVLGCKNSVIPTDGSIKSIGCYAFMGIGDCESENRDIFSKIDIPDSVEIIEHHAFADSGLIDIELPQGLKKIGSMAFMLTRLGKDGKRIFLPNTVEEMGIGVFAGCKDLSRVFINSNRYKTESDSIVDIETKTIVAVHNGSFAEILPYIADKTEELTFLGQNKGTKYYFDDHITEIKKSPLNIPHAIEFPITMIVVENSYAHKFALSNDVDYEIWK